MKYVKKSLWLALVGTLVVGLPLLAQFPIGIGAVPVTDISSEVSLSQQLIKVGLQLATERAIQSSTGLQQVWLAQVVLNKLPWKVPMLAQAQTLPATNMIGETIPWNLVLSTGVMNRAGWTSAAAQLSPYVYPYVIQRAGIGSNSAAQMATVETMTASGTNNLAIVGQARNYINTTVPAQQSLAQSILSSNPADNGPTQQMQYVAAGTSQNNATAVQQLQVQTGQLEALTTLSKALSDSYTADLNIQADQRMALATEATGVGGFASAFTNHP